MTSTATFARPVARPAVDPVARLVVDGVRPLTPHQLAAAAALAHGPRQTPEPQPECAAGPKRTRITRRGRLVLLTAVALLLLIATSLGRVSLTAATDAEAPLPTRQITVHEGDTLWTIAARVAPQADRREAIEQLRRLNDLSGSGLVAGQALTVPA